METDLDISKEEQERATKIAEKIQKEPPAELEYLYKKTWCRRTPIQWSKWRRIDRLLQVWEELNLITPALEYQVGAALAQRFVERIHHYSDNSIKDEYESVDIMMYHWNGFNHYLKKSQCQGITVFGECAYPIVLQLTNEVNWKDIEDWYPIPYTWMMNVLTKWQMVYHGQEMQKVTRDFGSEEDDGSPYMPYLWQYVFFHLPLTKKGMRFELQCLAMCNLMDRVKRYFEVEHKQVHDNDACYYAAKNGNLEMLQYLRSKKCPWVRNITPDARMYRAAIRSESIPILEYVHTARIPSNPCDCYVDDAMTYTLLNGSKPIFHRLCELGYRVDIIDVFKEIRDYGRLSIIAKWLDEIGFKWDYRVTNHLIKEGQLNVLKYMVETHHVPIQTDQLPEVIKQCRHDSGYWPMVDYLRSRYTIKDNPLPITICERIDRFQHRIGLISYRY